MFTTFAFPHLLHPLWRSVIGRALLVRMKGIKSKKMVSMVPNSSSLKMQLDSFARRNLRGGERLFVLNIDGGLCFGTKCPEVGSEYFQEVHIPNVKGNIFASE